MELHVRTLHGGGAVLQNLDPTMDFSQLKAMLHKEHAHLNLPQPAHQRIVHRNKVLDKGAIGQALSTGDTIVAIGAAAPPPQPVLPSTPAPDATAIRAAIIAEARRRGVADQLVEERPRQRASPFGQHGLPPELMAMERPLMQLLQALEGHMMAQQGAGDGAGGEAQAAAGPGPGADDPMTAAMQQLANAFGVPMDQLQQGNAGGAAAAAAAGEHQHRRLFGPPQAAPGPPPPPPEVRAPEPSPAAIEQLTAMGFAEPVVRKALALTRNNVESALEWALMHAEDPDAAEPPTQEQLRQVYGQPAGPRVMTESEAVGQLMDMGFGREQATAAIRRYRNMEMALAYLLQAGAVGAAPLQPAAPQPAAASAVGAPRTVPTQATNGAPVAAGMAAAAGGGPAAGAAPDLGMFLGGAAGMGMPGFGMPLHLPQLDDDEDEDDEADDEEDEDDDDMADAGAAVARDAAQLSDLLMRIIQGAQQPEPDGPR